MKTEIQIAKENIEKLKRIKSITLKDDLLDTISKNIHISECQEHKQTCQRFLKWLENFYRNCKKEETIFEIHDKKDIEEKIQDLKTAIKLYEQEEI